MDENTVKKFIPFVIVVIAALAVGFFAGNWWAKRIISATPAPGSGARPMTQQEVQNALRGLSTPGPANGSARPMTQQEIQNALKSLGAPGK